MFSRWLSSESAVNASSASYPCRAIRIPLAWSMTDRDERAWRRLVTMSLSARVVSIRWNTWPDGERRELGELDVDPAERVGLRWSRR